MASTNHLKKLSFAGAFSMGLVASCTAQQPVAQSMLTTSSGKKGAKKKTFSFSDLNNTELRTYGKSAFKWKRVKPGFNLRGECLNRECVVFWEDREKGIERKSKTVLSPHGFEAKCYFPGKTKGVFHIGAERTCAKCCMCGELLYNVVGCGFLRCKWAWEGKDVEGVVWSGSGEDDEKKGCYTRCISEKGGGNLKEWAELFVKVVRLGEEIVLAAPQTAVVTTAYEAMLQSGAVLPGAAVASPAVSCVSESTVVEGKRRGATHVPLPQLLPSPLGSMVESQIISRSVSPAPQNIIAGDVGSDTTVVPMELVQEKALSPLVSSEKEEKQQELSGSYVELERVDDKDPNAFEDYAFIEQL